MSWTEEIKKMAYYAGDYNNLPSDAKAKVDKKFNTEVETKVKTEIKRRGQVRLNRPTVKKIEEELLDLKLTNTYYLNNSGGFEGGFRVMGYSENEAHAGEKQMRMVNARAWPKDTPLPPPDEEIVIESTYYEALEEEIKQIGHPMKYAERKDAWEKALTSIERYVIANVDSLTQDDVKALENVKEIMSGGDYKTYTYEDPKTGETKIGRGSDKTGAKGRHIDKINELIEAVSNMITKSENKSWQETLKAKESLADYITEILEEMGIDPKALKR